MQSDTDNTIVLVNMRPNTNYFLFHYSFRLEIYITKWQKCLYFVYLLFVETTTISWNCGKWKRSVGHLELCGRQKDIHLEGMFINFEQTFWHNRQFVFHMEAEFNFINSNINRRQAHCNCAFCVQRKMTIEIFAPTQHFTTQMVFYALKLLCVRSDCSTFQNAENTFSTWHIAVCFSSHSVLAWLYDVHGNVQQSTMSFTRCVYHSLCTMTHRSCATQNSDLLQFNSLRNFTLALHKPQRIRRIRQKL